MMSDILLTLMEKVELGELTKDEAINMTLDEILELCVEQFLGVWNGEKWSVDDFSPNFPFAYIF